MWYILNVDIFTSLLNDQFKSLLGTDGGTNGGTKEGTDGGTQALTLNDVIDDFVFLWYVI